MDMIDFINALKGFPFYINVFARLISSYKLLTEEIVKKEFYQALPYLAIHLKSMWDKLNFSEQKNHCSTIG